jgi:plasmid stabilization system protein ParE
MRHAKNLMTLRNGILIEGVELRDRFIHAVTVAIQAAAERPLSFSIISGTEVRRVLVKDFPYSVIYRLESDRVFIFSIFHQSRNPIVWRGRID